MVLKPEPKPQLAKTPFKPKVIPRPSKPVVEKKKPESKVEEAPVQAVKAEETAKKVEKKEYILPSMELLDSPPPLAERKLKEDLDTSSKILEETLGDFGLEVKVVKVERGPVITRYELEPAPGLKINKISARSDDIALAMKAQSVRIVAPIPKTIAATTKAIAKTGR